MGEHSFVRACAVVLVDQHGKKPKKGEHVVLLLFNDLLIIADEKERKSEQVYDMRNFVKIVELQVHARGDEGSLLHASMEFTIFLFYSVAELTNLLELVGFTEEPRSVLVCFDSANDKREWQDDVRAQTDRFKCVIH